MADTMVAPTNKPVAMMGRKNVARSGGAVTVPSPAAEARSAKKKAGAMLKQGLISDAQHKSLSAKADRLMGMSVDDGAGVGASPVMPGNP